MLLCISICIHFAYIYFTYSVKLGQYISLCDKKIICMQNICMRIYGAGCVSAHICACTYSASLSAFDYRMR